MGQNPAAEPNENVVKTYECPLCRQERAITITPALAKKIDDHYADPSLQGQPISYPDMHKGKVGDTDNCAHTIRVNFGSRADDFMVRSTNPLYLLLSEEDDGSGAGKYSTMQKRDTPAATTQSARFVYPDYQKDILGKTKELYARAKQVLNDAQLPEDLRLPSVMKLHKAYLRYLEQVESVRIFKDTGKDARGRPVKDPQQFKQKYEAIVAKNKPLAEEHERIMKTKILRFDGYNERGGDVSETLTYQQIMDELERWHARISCKKKELHNKNETVWFEIYKPQEVRIKIKARTEPMYGTPIQAFPQQKLTETSRESMIGALNKIFSLKANPSENDPFFVWTYLFDEDVESLQGAFETALYSTELVAKYAWDYGTIHKALKDKRNKDLSKDAPITITELNKTNSRKQWMDQLDQIEREALSHTPYSLESINRKRHRIRMPKLKGELEIGAAAIGGGGALIPVREYLLQTYDLENQFFHFAQELGAQPTSAQTLAHDIIDFCQQYMPFLIGGAIGVGAAFIGLGIKRAIEKKSNKDRHGIDIGFANYAELKDLISLNDAIREERETTLVNFFPERPDLFIKDLARWDERLARGKLVSQLPDRR